MRRGLAWCSVILFAAFGCGDDNNSCPLPDAGGVTASQLIGPEGGEIALASGGKVEIPAGALSEAMMITIAEAADPKPLPLGLDAAGKTLSFTPHGTEFDEPVTITLPFDDDDATAVFPMKLEDDDDESWEAVVAGVDKESDAIKVTTSTFSVYVPARPRRGSGVIALPDGAVILPGVDAAVSEDAAVGDADLMSDAGLDGAVATDGAIASDGAIDAGCGATDGGCEVGDIVAIGAAATSMCALYSAGVVYCWGDNSQGQLGRGTAGSNQVPMQVELYTGAPLTDVVAISSGPAASHACAVRGDGSVVCWGQNNQGQCGANAQSTASRAYVVPAIANATKVTVGGEHSCALLDDGEVRCWGSNASGKLGNGDTGVISSSTPLAVVEFNPAGAPTVITDAIDVVAGRSHTCVVHTRGAKVSCFGSNDAGGGWTGLLGRGTGAPSSDAVAAPVMLPQGMTVAALSLGTGFYASHTCVIPMAPANAVPVCWGTNTYQQIAPSGGSVATPQSMDAIYDAPIALALGRDFTCVAYDNASFGSRVACQGSCGNVCGTGTGTSGVPSDVRADATGSTFLVGSQVELMTAGGSFVCAKLTGGGVTCWGTNNAQVFGDSAPIRDFVDQTLVVPGLP